ncbi:hypothetical protein EKL30_14775 [Candidimonas sp. SYP-B2681]|uniref:hypothetical protein n=1 Tax=Candidimonas sp. SYP-B2681 TaxID=2497686 RepID=UPI000F89C658|nr:hypothetical protein [Candidimonas sp. SYP-B2681]RTZ40957.1 hypothetical protein EKL30_14775 [Candidimonas sp. SYP-B2681]
MKIGIIFLSILAAAGTWWWSTQFRRPDRRPPFTTKIKHLFKSLVAGAAVYFVLMSLVLIYLTVSTG